MARERNAPVPHASWIEFEQRHAGHPFLNEDPIYALNDEVINAIKREVPKFFTAEEEGFERDLARSGRNGFFLRNPFSFDLLGVAPRDVRRHAAGAELVRTSPTIEQFLHMNRSSVQTQPLVDEIKSLANRPGQDDARQLLQEMVDLLRATDKAVRAPADRPPDDHAARQQQRLQVRHEAYAGWLVLNPTYRRELEALRQQCHGWVAEQGEFPWASAYGGPPGLRVPAPSGCCNSILCFYKRWGLESLLTWELPLPVDVACEQATELVERAPFLDGVGLLIPWPLLRGQQIDFQAALAHMRRQYAPEHLRGWLASEGTERSGSSRDITYQRLFTLYCVYHLVLEKRYGTACKRKWEALVRAMASVMGERSDELVRKLRLRLNKELRAL